MKEKVMSVKIVQLDMFKTDKEQFEEMVVKSMRGLFARDTARQKELKKLIERNLELEEIIFRMSNRLNRIAGEIQQNV